MNFYKLDNKSTDDNFLNGKTIQCRAILSVQDYNTGVVGAGDKIVIMLSNGKKYMGKVSKAALYPSKDGKNVEGILEIIKH